MVGCLIISGDVSMINGQSSVRVCGYDLARHNYTNPHLCVLVAPFLKLAGMCFSASVYTCRYF